jgi:hypothetical protein
MKFIKSVIPDRFGSVLQRYRKEEVEKTNSTTQISNYIELLDQDKVPRPHYGYCILKAAEQAKILGYDKISVLEFGVAGGNGLLNIEWHIKKIKKVLDMNFEVYGFDTGKGLPRSSDPRDVPYLWFEGDFVMDEELLRSRLDHAHLVIGDVKETVKNFFDRYKPAPVACIFEDLDYYTSTLDSFEIFNTNPNNYLPRIPIYFDDVIGRFEFPMNEYIGELAAINKFNEVFEAKKIAKINYLRLKRRVSAKWNEQIYIFQDFGHPKYSEPIREKQPQKTALK